MNRAGSSLIAVIFLLALGCAHRSTAPTSEAKTPDVASIHEHVAEPFRVSDPEPPQVADEELEVIHKDMHSTVDQWVRYFQNKGRPHMERYLARSGRYSTLMKRILRQNGLPEDLIYIALIESGFSSRATSRAAAVGYWQFIKGTGKRYGLEINSLVDERRDPVLATQAAAEYFKGLYSIFGSWYLSMASYNVGENRVKREMTRNYTRDFWEIAKKRRLPKETVNYVPKYVAARMIAKNPEKYGFTNIEYEDPIEFDVIKIDQPLNLRQMAAKLNLEYEDFKQINPKFRGEVAPTKSNGSLELRVPAGMMEAGLIAARESVVERVELIADAGDLTSYKIRRGDSLNTIARRFRTTVSIIRDINDLKPGRKLRVGSRLQVPERDAAKKTKVIVAKREALKAAKPEKLEKVDDQETAVTNPEIVRNGQTFYVVQAGDTLSAVADDYDSSIKELRRLNRMSKGSVLKIGMRLRVPPKDTGLPKDPKEVESSKSTDTSNVAQSESGPESKIVTATEPAAAKSESPKAAAIRPTAVSANAQDENGAHMVRAGENLTTIAKRYGISIQALRKANNLKSRTVLRSGARLLIPGNAADQGTTLEGGARRPANSSSQFSVKRKVVSSGKSKGKVHVVRRGENLTEIAAHYGVTLDRLTRENNLRSASRVFVGARLLIPLAEAGE